MYNKNKIYLVLATVTAIVLILLLIWAVNRPEEIPDTGVGTTPGVTIPNDTAEKFIEKGDVSQSAEETKQELIAPLGGSAGTLFENEEIRIDYIPPIDPFPDRFSIEIFISDGTKAKQTAVEWFGEEGFSNEDICELPIIFFLSDKATEEYKQQEREFNPLLENC